MNIDLSEKELTLLEDALFEQIIKKHTEVFRESGPKKAELSKHVNELEGLNHKIRKKKEGIK